MHVNPILSGDESWRKIAARGAASPSPRQCSRNVFSARYSAFAASRTTIESSYRPCGGRATRIGMIDEGIFSLIPCDRWTPRCSTSRNTTISIRWRQREGRRRSRISFDSAIRRCARIMPVRVWFYVWIAIILRQEPIYDKRQVGNIRPLTPYWCLIDRWGWLLSIVKFSAVLVFASDKIHDSWFCAFSIAIVTCNFFLRLLFISAHSS